MLTIYNGKCMVIDVKSNIDTMIIVRLDRGTKLIPQDSSKQDMIVTKTINLPVYPRVHFSSSFYAMCGQMYDGIPEAHDEYSLDPNPVVDQNIIRLTAVLESEWLQDIRGQAAIWAYTDDADSLQLSLHGADSRVLLKVISALDEASVVCELNPTLPVPEPKPTSNLPVAVQLNKTNQVTLSVYWIYGAGVLILSMVVTNVVLFRRNRKIKPNS